MQIRLKDVAEKTGFSITTVSRALAGYNDVNEQTRQHIIEVAKALGYQPNALGRQLRNQRTQSLGLIIPERDHSFSNDFFSQLILGIGDAAAHQHYDLLISAQAPGEEEMAAYHRIVAGNRVDGMILARTRHHDPRIAYLQKHHHPFVAFGRRSPEEVSDFAYLDVDGQVGVRLLVEHLIERGHRAIGLILPPEEMAFTFYRHMGYRDGLNQAGLPYQHQYVVYGDLLRSGGHDGADMLLNQHPELTALIACNDLMAFGAISAIQQRGLTVGRDIAVVGFDDIPMAEYANLTTMRQPIYEIGQRLVSILTGLIAGGVPTQELLAPTLVVRASSSKEWR